MAGSVGGVVMLATLGGIQDPPPSTVEVTSTTAGSVTTTTNLPPSTVASRPDDAVPFRLTPKPPDVRAGQVIEMTIFARVNGILFWPHGDHDDCQVDLNGGVARNGYRAQLGNLRQDVEFLIPYSLFIRSSGERFESETTAPQWISAECDGGNLGHWEW